MYKRQGKDVAARLAVKLESGLVTDAVDLALDGDAVVATQSVVNSLYVAKTKITKGPALSLIHI